MCIRDRNLYRLQNLNPHLSLQKKKCANRQKKPHILANRLPVYANSVMRISPPCKNHSGGLPTTAFCCMDTTTTIIFFYWKKTNTSGLVFPVFILPVKDVYKRQLVTIRTVPAEVI